MGIWDMCDIGLATTGRKHEALRIVANHALATHATPRKRRRGTLAGDRLGRRPGLTSSRAFALHIMEMATRRDRDFIEF